MTTENTKAAGRKIGDTRMVCEHDTLGVRYAAQSVIGFDSKGDLIWEEYAHRLYLLEELPKVFTDGDAMRTLEGYGLRAWLADRTSQFRKIGPDAVLQAMDSYFDECLKKSLWVMPRATGGKAPRIDPALIAVIVRMKNIPHATAEAALSKLSPDDLAALTAKLADAIAKERALMATAGADLDLGDLL